VSPPQAAEAAEAAKLQAAKAAALAQKQVQMEQLEQMKARILEERWVGDSAGSTLCGPGVPVPQRHEL
jgi:hypothetical protein